LRCSSRSASSIERSPFAAAKSRASAERALGADNIVKQRETRMSASAAPMTLEAPSTRTMTSRLRPDGLPDAPHVVVDVAEQAHHYELFGRHGRHVGEHDSALR